MLHVQAGLRLHTFPRPAFKASSWSMQVTDCRPDQAPKRDLPFNAGANMAFRDSEQVSLSPVHIAYQMFTYILMRMVLCALNVGLHMHVADA